MKECRPRPSFPIRKPTRKAQMVYFRFKSERENLGSSSELSLYYELPRWSVK